MVVVKRSISWFIVLFFVSFHSFSQINKSIILLDAGSLEYFLKKEASQIRSLTIGGTINSSDLSFLSKMAGRDDVSHSYQLSILDLSKSRIISEKYDKNGSLYYTNKLSEEEFKNSDYLTSIILPDILEKMEDDVFYSCDKLASISISSTNQNYKSIDGVLFTKDGKTLIKFPPGKDISTYYIPNSVINIGASAFSGHPGLISIIIPENVSYIGHSAFSGCDKLKSIRIPDHVTSIKYDTFYDCDNLEFVFLPDGLVSIDDAAFSSCKNLKSISLPNSLKKIGMSAFSGCGSLKTITIPQGIQSIAYDAFGGYDNSISVVRFKKIAYDDVDYLGWTLNDLPHGSGKCFKKNGELLLEGTFDHGKLLSNQPSANVQNQLSEKDNELLKGLLVGTAALIGYAVVNEFSGKSEEKPAPVKSDYHSDNNSTSGSKSTGSGESLASVTEAYVRAINLVITKGRVPDIEIVRSTDKFVFFKFTERICNSPSGEFKVARASKEGYYTPPFPVWIRNVDEVRSSMKEAVQLVILDLLMFIVTDEDDSSYKRQMQKITEHLTKNYAGEWYKTNWYYLQ